MFKWVYSGFLVLCMMCPTKSVLYGQTLKDSNGNVEQKNNPGQLYHSKYVVKGIVRDAEDGSRLSYVSLYIAGSQLGTTTDTEGHFALYFDQWLGDTVVFQALGYERTTSLLKRGSKEYALKVSMPREAKTISEFTINASGVDPAILMVRRIIAHKPENNPDKVENYSYRAYNRVEIDIKNISSKQLDKYPVLNSYGFLKASLDTNSSHETFLPSYLTENLSDYYFRRQPKKIREVTIGSLTKGVKNGDITRYLGTNYAGINVYNNGIPVVDKKFVSPISDQALLFYKYSIRDTEYTGGHRIIRLDYKPRHNGNLCFEGSLRVVDSIYAIAQIELDVPKTVNFNWADRIKVDQHFALTQGHWFVDHEYFELSVSAYEFKKIPGLIVRKTTDYHDILLNSAKTDSMLDRAGLVGDVTTADSTRNRGDDWWQVNRPDTLNKREINIQKMSDSILAMPVTRHYIELISFLASGVKDVGPIELGPYWYIYSNNPIEGDRFRISVGTPRTIKDLHLSVYGAYGIADHRYKYGGEGKWVINRRAWAYLDLIYKHDLSTGTDHPEYVEGDNIFANLVRKAGIPWKQAFTDLAVVQLYQLFYSGFSATLQLQHKVFTPYAPLPSTGIFRDEKGNPADAVTSFATSADFRYAYQEKYIEGKYGRAYIGTKYPIFDFIYTVGIKHVINSAYDFKKVNFSVKESINIPGLGGISYTLYGGKYFGVLPYSLLEVHPGNEYLIYGPNLFEMMNAYEFISDQFLGLKVEHDLGGGLFNYVPLLKKLKLRQFWTAKGLIGSLSQANSELNQYHGYEFKSLAGNPYIELGTGIANILRVARIDFVWRVAPAAQPNENLSKHFGIFGSAQLQF